MTSLPIIGGITASGVFLLFISVVGLIGAMRHHQVMLFFYMVVLFFIFIIQFSCSCAALSVNENDQKTIIRTSWNNVMKFDTAKSLIVEAERQLDCCGLGLYDNNTIYQTPSPADHNFTVQYNVFSGHWDSSDCAKENWATTCKTCFPKIQEKVKLTCQMKYFFLFSILMFFRFKKGLMQLVVLAFSSHFQR